MRVEEALRSVDRRLYTDGGWVDAADGATFTTLNPTTDEPLARIAIGSSVEVHRAVESGRAAFGGRWTRRRGVESRRWKGASRGGAHPCGDGVG